MIPEHLSTLYNEENVFDNLELAQIYTQNYVEVIENYRDGEELGCLKFYEDAIFYHDQAIKLGLKYFNDRQEYGEDLKKEGNDEEAFNFNNQDKEVKQTMVQACCSKIRCLYKLGLNKQAFEFVNEIKNIDFSELNNLAQLNFFIQNTLLLQYSLEQLKISTFLQDDDPLCEFLVQHFIKTTDPQLLQFMIMLQAQLFAIHNKNDDIFRQEALDYINELLQKNDQNISALQIKGAILEMNNHYEKAIQCWDKVLYLTPQNTSALFQKSSLLIKLRQYENAIKLYNQILKLNPNSISAYSLKGKTLMKIKKYPEALYCFDEAINLDQKDCESCFHKGTTLLKLNKYQEAIQWFNKAIALNPIKLDPQLQKLGQKFLEAIQSKIVFQDEIAFQLLKGFTLLKLNEWREAILCYDNVIYVDPKNNMANANKGYALVKLQKHYEAIKYFDNAIEINQKLNSVLTKIGQVLFHYRHENEAVIVLQQTITINPNEFYYICIGFFLFLRKQFQEALKHYNTAIKLDQTNPLCYNNKGVLLMEIEEYQNAMQCFDQGLSLNQYYLAPLINKGIILRKQQKYKEGLVCFEQEFYQKYQLGQINLQCINENEQAIKCFKDVIEISTQYQKQNGWKREQQQQKKEQKKCNPLNSDLIKYYNSKHKKNLGIKLFKLDKSQEEIQYDDNKSAFQYILSQAILKQCQSLMKLRKYQDTIHCCDQGISINKKNPQLLNLKADCLFKLNQYDDAIKFYNQSLQLNQLQSGINLNKGNVLQAQSKFRLAIECYQKAIKIHPKYYYAYINMSVSLINLEMFEQALSNLQQAIEISPLSVEAYQQMGDLLLNLNRNEGALDCYEKVINIDSKSQEAYLNKSCILYDLKRLDEALQCLNRAQELKWSSQILNFQIKILKEQERFGEANILLQQENLEIFARADL